MKLNCKDCKKQKTCNDICGCMFGFCHFGEPNVSILTMHKNAVSKLFCKNIEVKQFIEKQLACGSAFVVHTKAKTTKGLANAINSFLHVQSVKPIDITHWQNEKFFFFDGGVIVNDLS